MGLPGTAYSSIEQYCDMFVGASGSTLDAGPCPALVEWSQGDDGHLQPSEWHSTHAQPGLSRESWMSTAGNQCCAALYKHRQGVPDEDRHCHP